MRRTAAQYGITEDTWATAKQQVRSVILRAAYERRMTWHAEIADRVDAVSLDPASSLINDLLAAVFADEYATGGPALTSIVTVSYGDLEPNSAFYTSARDLGYRFTEPFTFWTEEVHKVFAEHGRPEGRR
ncbi:hypothetical protein Dvina_37485 [Dactylosporangium vinaceum]|uniref:Uncharacterized protein n=1 Tax=Dactylosporangium vinaceum TaxID=53362 RepID=A0ABV5MQX0_9ACTN|nr:hypothetical protein [Dactylosporangium vinaceum]UAB93855.1 hypothetical protein Dvina_37485 [Dactylosporangium vinaceum]